MTALFTGARIGGEMSEGRLIRVLVVDDSVLYRKAIQDALATIEGVEVVGIAANGKIALSKIATLAPDLITLDIEMPEMDGIAVLKALREMNSKVTVVMVSSLTVLGGKMTMQALELGAFDFIPKPAGATLEANVEAITGSLRNIINAFVRKRYDFIPSTMPKARPAAPPPSPAVAPAPRPAFSTAFRQKSSAVAIGVSTGGPLALVSVIPKLPANLGVPVFIVQHMPPLFTKSLAENLQSKSQLSVVEASDGEVVKPNVVYIAPGGKQMRVVKNGTSVMIQTTDDPPENSCRPSVDYLFRSLPAVYGAKLTTVIMTGMGADGVKEMLKLRDLGVTTMAQDRESCVVYGMPKEAAESGAAASIVRLGEIADEIVKTVR